METEQRNRVTMFKTVSTYLGDRNSVWSGMAPLQAALTEFNDKIAAIDIAAQKQQAPVGSTQDKAAARDALEDVLFLTCEALGVLGYKGNDHNLSALTAMRPSTLQRLDDEALSNRATSVLAEATARKTELAGMQVTEANIDELNDALQTFNASKASPRMATAVRMVQTESLPVLIREASAILRNEIDRMVSLFRRSNPEFVAGYRGARVIVDRAASRTTNRNEGSTPTPAE